MQEEDKRRMKRVTVTLDCDTVKILEDMANEEDRSVSEIVRFAINHYYKNKKSYGELKPEILNIISELLSKRENIIIDISLWTVILEELNKVADDGFWKSVEDIGREYGIQLMTKGFKDIYNILKYLEITNLYRVKIYSNKIYILILTIKAETKILSSFLRGIFDALKKPVEIIEGSRKLIIIEKNNNQIEFL